MRTTFLKSGISCQRAITSMYMADSPACGPARLPSHASRPLVPRFGRSANDMAGGGSVCSSAACRRDRPGAGPARLPCARPLPVEAGGFPRWPRANGTPTRPARPVRHASLRAACPRREFPAQLSPAVRIRTGVAVLFLNRHCLPKTEKAYLCGEMVLRLRNCTSHLE